MLVTFFLATFVPMSASFFRILSIRVQEDFVVLISVRENGAGLLMDWEEAGAHNCGDCEGDEEKSGLHFTVLYNLGRALLSM